MKSKVLFIYPNVSGIRRIPLGISILSACLKKAGHLVELFDATFYKKTDAENEKREELGFVLKVDMSPFHTRFDKGDVREDLKQKIELYNPDIIALSLLEDNYHFARRILDGIKEYSSAFVVAGGTMPTLVPNIVLKGMNVDAVMVGEGEKAIVELANCISRKDDPFKVLNIAHITNERLSQNQLMTPVSLSELPYNDYSIFDEEHLWRPFIGQTRKTGFVELTRGCPYNCTFCANRQLNEIYKDERVIRTRDIDQFIEEVNYLKEKYTLEQFFFCDENFLSNKHLDEFTNKWESQIGTPFMVQTRIESIKPDKLEKLKRAGCNTIAIGIESGSEEFRRNMLNRQYSNDKVMYAFQCCREAGIRSTANNIIGFPRESEEQIIETIALNRVCTPDSVSIAIFGPYRGSELYKVCVEDGLVDDDIPELGGIMYESSLKFPKEYLEMVNYYFNNFQDLVFSNKEIKRYRPPN
jgi:anaerobic magnesium-protoporphyrin IX monomethyl ester cyclase